MVQKLLASLRADPVRRDLPPLEQARTSEGDARRIAHQWVMARHLLWDDPIRAKYVYHENGQPCWVVRSNYGGQGFSLIITIDDASGQVIASRSLPR